MKNTIIISGFPGVGKSYFVENAPGGLVVLDSDSSHFGKDQFPWNYIDHIESNIGKADVILVSSHKEVREALKEAGVLFYTVSPIASCKQEYIQRYKDRSKHLEFYVVARFIAYVEQNWDEWIADIDAANNNNAFVLYPGKYLSDVFESIQAFHRGKSTVDYKRFRKSLTESEWRELVALEYVLTWHYSDDTDKDSRRHAELRDKKDLTPFP